MSARDTKDTKDLKDTKDAAAKPSKIPLGLAGAAVVLVGIMGGLMPAIVVALALLGTPLFAVMGGGSEIAWLVHADEKYHHFRFIAPNVLDEKFAGSPILVTIPLFTLVGYTLARAKTAERIVRVSDDEIEAAMRTLFADTHNVAEGAGAASFAALMQEREAMRGKRVAVVLSGGNVDSAPFARVLGH